ncbi:MAG TPA: hypothetical protein VE570_08275, partial [Thermoleophilaceae bacterium]|nr:hypothetical protein [Thermoleophilaceae bacterium]
AFGLDSETEGNKIPPIERANAYPDPSNYMTAGKYGIISSFSCANTTAKGEKSDVSDKNPPCRVQGKNSWDGSFFPRLDRGKSPNAQPPIDASAKGAAQPQHYK